MFVEEIISVYVDMVDIEHVVDLNGQKYSGFLKITERLNRLRSPKLECRM